MARCRPFTHAASTCEADLPVKFHAENTPALPANRKGQSGKVLLCPQQDNPATSVAHFCIAVLTETEGLDTIFLDAGFEWRAAGCSMCVAMNDDRLQPGQRCASTSNRNFEGRQGQGGRTHLMSPEMAAAAAVTGRLVDVRTMIGLVH